VKSQLWHEFSV